MNRSKGGGSRKIACKLTLKNVLQRYQSSKEDILQCMGLLFALEGHREAFLGRLHWDALRRAVSSDLCHHPTSGHCQQPGILLRQVRQLSCKLHKNVRFNMTRVAQTAAAELVGHVFSQQKTNLVSTYRKWKILRHHHHNPPATIFLVVSPTASGYKF